MNKRIFAVIFSTVLLFSGFTFISCDRSVKQESDPETESSFVVTSNTAKDFTVTDADGNSVRLSCKIGKPIIVNFWATWCPPCRSEMPHFDKAYAELGNEIEFMMVDLTDGFRDTVESAQQYIAENGYAFPVYFDTLNNASRTYSINSIPLTLFIDKNGQLVKTKVGAMSEDELYRYIKLIKE